MVLSHILVVRPNSCQFDPNYSSWPPTRNLDRSRVLRHAFRAARRASQSTFRGALHKECARSFGVQAHLKHDVEELGKELRVPSELLLEERLPGSRKSRKFWQDSDSEPLRVEEEDWHHSLSPTGVTVQRGGGGGSGEGVLKAPLFSLPTWFTTFYLPAGYPTSVTPDYNAYTLWLLPTHITGWAASTLVTSTLLSAVGIGSVDPTHAVAATAAIKWVTKDGIGALGRFLIGGQFGSLFDENPRQWRMVADCIGSCGSVFELATPLHPASFLVLASMGNFTKAVGRGLRDPSERVIQNHLAIASNLGDVAAKQEVLDVTGQLIGLVLGVLLLRTPGVSSSYWSLITCWFCLRSSHLVLRFKSLKLLDFETINFKRAAILIRENVAGRPVPGVQQCNRLEGLLRARQTMTPGIAFGCSVEDLLGKGGREDLSSLLGLYEGEEYVLTGHNGGRQARVAFKAGASNVTLMRAMWQAQWLHQRGRTQRRQAALDTFQNGAPAELSDLPIPIVDGNKRICFEELRASLLAMQVAMGGFELEVRKAGWNLAENICKVPLDAPLLVVHERFRRGKGAVR